MSKRHHYYRPLVIQPRDLVQRTRLDTLLARHYGFLTRHQWQKRICGGDIWVNGTPVRSAYRVKTTDNIRYYQPPEHEPTVNRNVVTLYEDDELIVVNKPSNLPIHPVGKYYYNTLTSILEANKYTHSPVHRLDRDTSGLVICAQTPLAKESFRRQFESRQVKKEYLAITYGPIEKDRFTVDAPIAEGCMENGRPRMVIGDNGAPSLTHFQVTERRGLFSLLRVFPQSGRTNQIRVHLEYAGCPIVGDPLYTGNYDPLDCRLALHAHRIAVTHPKTTRKIDFSAPMPEDFATIWHTMIPRLEDAP